MSKLSNQELVKLIQEEDGNETILFASHSRKSEGFPYGNLYGVRWDDDMSVSLFVMYYMSDAMKDLEIGTNIDIAVIIKRNIVEIEYQYDGQKILSGGKFIFASVDFAKRFDELTTRYITNHAPRIPPEYAVDVDKHTILTKLSEICTPLQSLPIHIDYVSTPTKSGYYIIKEDTEFETLSKWGGGRAKKKVLQSAKRWSDSILQAYQTVYRYDNRPWDKHSLIAMYNLIYRDSSGSIVLIYSFANDDLREYFIKEMAFAHGYVVPGSRIKRAEA